MEPSGRKLTQGFAVIISAPSGGGKSTVCHKLMQRDHALRYSVSCTTRLPRPAEKNGRDYHFLSVDEFKRRMHRNEFLEFATVHGQYYGTPKHLFDQTIADGSVILLAIDVQGASNIRAKRPGTVAIFLIPPSWASLRNRLRGRRQDGKEEMERRLANARGEIAQAKNYEYLVVNDNLDDTVDQIEAIITAERLKLARQDLASFGIPELTLK
ncbi:MAG: guanylate kinase [Elusimicrobia bacterium]|nr:guanylate kinase [Elusimicrobiota bacterium]